MLRAVKEKAADGETLRRVIEVASEKVHEAGKRADRRGMGATLTAVFQVDARRVTQLDEDARFDGLAALLAKHLGETVTVTVINGEGAPHDIFFPVMDAKSGRVTEAGKSSTLKAIMGMAPVSRGTVRVSGATASAYLPERTSAKPRFFCARR